MKKNITNIYNRVILKPLTEDYIEELRILRNKKENSRWFIFQDEISKTQQIEWFNNYLKKTDDYTFYITTINNPDEFIGCVAVYNIDTVKQKAEFGRIVIDKDKIKDKGIGYDATMGICEIAFNHLNINKLYLEVFEDNIPAIKTYEKAGFKKIKSYELENKQSIIYMEKNKE